MVWYSSLVYCEICNKEDQIPDDEAQILADNPYVCGTCSRYYSIKDLDAPILTGTCRYIKNKYNRRRTSSKCNRTFKYQGTSPGICEYCDFNKRTLKITDCKYCHKSTGDEYADDCLDCIDIIRDLKFFQNSELSTFRKNFKVIATYYIPSGIDFETIDIPSGTARVWTAVSSVKHTNSYTFTKVLPLLKKINKTHIDVLGYINLDTCPEVVYYQPKAQDITNPKYILQSLKVVKTSELFDFEAFDAEE
jgi:hypothetical protein